MNALLEKEDAALVIQGFRRQTESLIRASIADNTLKAYQNALGFLQAWLSENNADFSDDTLAAYLTMLYDAGKSPATIAQAVAVVKWQLKNGNVSQELPVTTRTLAGIRRKGKNRGRGQVNGLDWQQLERVCAFAEAEKTIVGLQDSAMIRLMSDCLLRVSEVAAVNVEDFEKKTLVVHQSKTEQEGQETALYLTADTRRVVKRYLAKASITQGAVFLRIRKGDNVGSERLTAFSVQRIIKKRATDAGVEGFISGHSLRVGSAVSLAAAGASVVDMQVAGRWKSSQMPAHYAKAELAERGAIARFKEGKRG